MGDDTIAGMHAQIRIRVCLCLCLTGLISCPIHLVVAVTMIAKVEYDCLGMG